MSRRVGLGAATLCLALTASAAPANAATIEVLPTNRPGAVIIAVFGELQRHDGDRFAEIAARHRKAGVLFNSPGGSLIAALQIGQVIRARRYPTLVPDRMLCASACAIAWVAGTPRYMQPDAKIGFHAAYEPGTHEQSGVGNALVGAYLMQLGLPVSTLVYIEQARPDEITWLTPRDALRIGLPLRVLAHSRPRHGEEAQPAG